jgi:putative DNA primase/helicase
MADEFDGLAPMTAPGPDGPGDPPAGDDLPPGVDAACARAAGLPLNDYGNGCRFALHFGEDVLFVPRVGWFTWSGLRWCRDPDGLAVRAQAHRIGKLIEGEIPHIALEPWQRALLGEMAGLKVTLARMRARRDLDDDGRMELLRVEARLDQAQAVRSYLQATGGGLRKHAKAAGNSNSLNNMLGEAQVPLSIAFDALDADPLAVNCESGVLVFRADREAQAAIRAEGSSDMDGTARFDLVPHDRAQRISKLMPVAFDPAAEAPLFTAFLGRIMPDAGMRAFLQRWFGLNLTALTGDQKMVFFHGGGSNGKSVLVDLMARMLGDYAATAKIESLTGGNKRSGADATPDLVPLMGARMVRASEPDMGERLKEGMIKELTGGEPMLVRALHSDFIEVRPLFKLTISGNHRPEIRGTDDGIWRRVLLVPFEVHIPREERDPDLGEKLWAERSGILNWMVAGLVQYLESGLREPDAVVEATRQFREDSDPLHRFLTECCVVTGLDTDFTRARDLIGAFNLWLDDRGETRWGGRTISLQLATKSRQWRSADGRTFRPGKSGDSGYRGIRLTDLFQSRLDRADAAGSRGTRREVIDDDVI